MASKEKTKVKGLGKDPSLCKLGQRMIHTMLREERIAERDLQEKLKAISVKEHKSMVKLGCDSLDIRHDLTRQRSSSPIPGGDGSSTDTDGLDSGLARPGLQGRRAISMLDYSYRQEQLPSRGNSRNKTQSHLKPSAHTNPRITVENHAENSSKEHGNILDDDSCLRMDELDKLSSSSNGNTSPALSPRLLKRRPVSDISSSSFSHVSCSSQVDEVIVEKIVLEKGLPAKVAQKPTTPPPRVPQRPTTCPTIVPQRPCTPPLRAPQRPCTPPLRAPQRPCTPPLRAPQRPSTPPSDFRKQRPSSARMVRPKSPASVGVTQETMRGRDRIRLDLPLSSTTKSRSPSPSRLSPDPLGCNLGRRGSGPPRINVNSLSPSSPLRKGLVTSDVTRSLAPNSPDALRRRLSANEEDLQDRVQGFLKTLEKK